jgi:ankyrin repeat protein
VPAARLALAGAGKRKVAELLLRHGATVERDAVGSVAPTNKTACHFAMQYGAEGGDAADACAMLEAILAKKPNVNACDAEKRTALHYVSSPCLWPPSPPIAPPSPMAAPRPRR